MCVPGLDPITLTALAASAGGAVLNGYESNQTQNSMISARNAATQAELARQRQYQNQAQQVFDQSLTNFKPEQQAADLTAQQGAATTAFTNNTPTAEQVGTISSASAPRVVQEAGAKKVGDVFARAGRYNDALGNLTGWDQRAFGNNIKLNNSGRDLGTISDFSRTSAAVNGLEQNSAYQNAFRPNSGIGDILSFAGKVGAYGSGKGWFNPATGMKTAVYSPGTSAGAIY